MRKSDHSFSLGNGKVVVFERHARGQLETKSKDFNRIVIVDKILRRVGWCAMSGNKIKDQAITGQRECVFDKHPRVVQIIHLLLQMEVQNTKHYKNVA